MIQRNPIITALDAFEEIAIELAARVGPWLIPILPAYTVGTAIYKHLNTWPAVAIIGAIAFELAGIAATKTALRCWTWNNARRKSDQPAPFGLAVTLALVYFLVGIGLSVALEVWTSLVVIAPASFFLLAGQSYFVLAIGYNLTKWENSRRLEIGQRAAKNSLQADIAELAERLETLGSDRDTLAAEIATGRQEIADMDAQIADMDAQIADMDNQIAKRRKILAGLKNDPETGQNRDYSPLNGVSLGKARAAKQDQIAERRDSVKNLTQQGLTVTEIAAHLGVSGGTIKSDRRALNGQMTNGVSK